MADTSLDSAWLPLGTNGQIVGIVRDATTGAGLAGYTVEAADSPADYPIRYLNEAGDAFTETGTASSGVFVAFGAGASPTAFVAKDGSAAVVGEADAGSASGVVFTTQFDVTP